MIYKMFNNLLLLVTGYRYNTTMPETTDAMVLFYHRMLESVKFGKALQTYMGDPVFDNISDVSDLFNTSYIII